MIIMAARLNSGQEKRDQWHDNNMRSGAQGAAGMG
jgi:hypothetical protein